jgi:hypothetical protein
MATATRVKKKEYRNNSDGYLHVITIDARNQERGVMLDPYPATVFLSDEEVELNAQAVRNRANSPFVEKQHVHRDIATGDVIREITGPTLELVAPDARNRGVSTRREPKASVDDREEVGTPQARSRRRPRATTRP